MIWAIGILSIVSIVISIVSLVNSKDTYIYNVDKIGDKLIELSDKVRKLEYEGLDPIYKSVAVPLTSAERIAYENSAIGLHKGYKDITIREELEKQKALLNELIDAYHSKKN